MRIYQAKGIDCGSIYREFVSAGVRMIERLLCLFWFQSATFILVLIKVKKAI